MAEIIKDFKNELSKEERIIDILNEARETAGVSQHINDYYMQSINELPGSHTFENGMLQLDDRGDRDISMLEAIYDIAKDEDRSLEDRGAAGSIIANSMILWNATIGEDERESSLELNFLSAVKDIDSHMELVELGYMGMNVPVGPYIEEDRKIDVETNLQYSVSINPQIDDYLTNEREKIVEKFRENCDRLDKEEGIEHSEQEKESKGIDLPSEDVQIDGNKIFEILNEARDKADVSPEIDDYGRQNRSKFISGERMSILPGAIMADDRGVDDRSFINSLYNIASDDNRSLEDRGVAAALIDNSVYVYEGGSRLSGPEDAKLEIRMNIEELIDKSEQNMYEMVIGTCEPSVSFGSYTSGRGFNEEKTYEYIIGPDIKADTEREQEREIAIDNMKDILTNIYSGVGGNLHVNDARDDVQLEFNQTDNYDVGFRIFEANGVERLMELANDPGKDEELRVTALACAMSAHSYEIYEEIDFHEYWNTTLYTDVDLNKVLDNIDSARELIEQNKVVNISYTHTFENHDEYEREEKTRTFSVNAPTMAQKEILDEIGYASSTSYNDKIKEYFPGVDSSDITSSALAKKMENDPEVIKGIEELSRDILWQQAEFINEHVIVIDRTDEFFDIYEGETKENPIKDLPDGTHYDVCIEKLENRDGEIEINVTFDKGLIEPMANGFNNLAEERDEEYFKLENGSLSKDSYSFKFEVSPDDFIVIRDMVTDIAHEHSLHQEHEVEPLLEQASQVKEEKSFDELMMDVRNIAGGWNTIHRDAELTIHDFINEDGHVDIKNAGAFHNLMDYASDPQNDDETRSIALASVMNMQIQYKHLINSPGPDDHCFIDYDGVKQSLDYAKDIISSGKLVEIDVPVSEYYEKTGIVFQKHDFSQIVNGITIQQREEINTIYNGELNVLGRKLDEYFPAIETKDISYSMLKEKMDNDPEISLLRDNISKNIERGAEFVNDHIMVVDRTYDNPYNVLHDDKFKEYKDLPNGEHYDVCIEKMRGEIPGVKITYDKEIHDDILKAMDSFAKENHTETSIKGFGISEDNHEMLLTPYQIMERENTKAFVIYPNDDELEKIKDIITDIAHEHSRDREEPDIEKDVLVNR